MAAAKARASRASATWTQAVSTAGGFGHADNTAAAPLATASVTKSMPLRAAPLQGGEEESGLDRLGVVGDPGYLYVSVPPPAVRADALEDVLELHGLSPFFSSAVRTFGGRGRSGGTRR